MHEHVDLVACVPAHVVCHVTVCIAFLFTRAAARQLLLCTVHVTMFSLDVPQTSTETFFRTSKFYKAGEEAPPIFIVDGVSYLSVKVNLHCMYEPLLDSCSDSKSSAWCWSCFSRAVLRPSEGTKHLICLCTRSSTRLTSLCSTQHCRTASGLQRHMRHCSCR